MPSLHPRIRCPHCCSLGQRWTFHCCPRPHQCRQPSEHNEWALPGLQHHKRSLVTIPPRAVITLCVLCLGGGGAAQLLWDHDCPRLQHRVRGSPLHQVLEARARANGRSSPADPISQTQLCLQVYGQRARAAGRVRVLHCTIVQQRQVNLLSRLEDA